jgi:hypothetical protein
MSITAYLEGGPSNGQTMTIPMAIPGIRVAILPPIDLRIVRASTAPARGRYLREIALYRKVGWSTGVLVYEYHSTTSW